MTGPSDVSHEEPLPRRTRDDLPPGVPRWVKLGAIALGIVLLVALAVALLSGGDHGPGRHLGGGASGIVTPVQELQV